MVGVYLWRSREVRDGVLKTGVRWIALRRRNAESQNIAKLAVKAGLKIALYFGAYWLLIDAEYPAMVYFNSRSKRGIRG